MPLVVFVYSGDYTEKDVAEHVASLGRLLATQRRCGVIFQLTGARALNAHERALFARFIREHSADLKRVCVAAALVTDSALHHGVLTAVSWVVPMPCEVKVFSKAHEADTWMLQRLSHAGVSESALSQELRLTIPRC